MFHDNDRARPNQPIARVSRTPDGKVNMTGPVSRVNGKPDLSGSGRLGQGRAGLRSPSRDR
jgi:hypothetical protein